MTTADHPLLRLLDLPGVRERVDAVRDDAAALRFHEGLRRRIPEAAAESRVRGAGASARLDGARLPDDVLREYAVGARAWPDPLDPTERVARGALQAVAEVEHLGRRALAQPRAALARLHTVSASWLLAPEALGRPRAGGEGCAELEPVGPAPSATAAGDRLRAVVGVLGELGAGAALPVPLVAAVVHAEVATARPFAAGNGLVARALERAVLVAGGTDATAVSVPEAGHEAAGHAAYVGALAAYATGGEQGVALWLTTALDAQRAGVARGVAVAGAVRRGRLT